MMLMMTKTTMMIDVAAMLKRDFGDILIDM